VPDPELPSLSYDEIRVFIANSPYTTHRRAPDEALFERSVMHIRKHGERAGASASTGTSTSMSMAGLTERWEYRWPSPS